MHALYTGEFEVGRGGGGICIAFAPLLSLSVTSAGAGNSPTDSW